MKNNAPSLSRRQVQSLSLVAQLLASENIRVQHLAKAQTATFETKTRTLTLPVWKEMSGDTYDMLVAHEVGHALFSPKGDDWVKELIALVGNKGFGRLKQYVNAVEDARIERGMKERYGGLRSVFAKAYRELTVSNPKLFALDRDIAELPLIDRINIHYKVGFAVEVKFTAEEMPLVKRVAETKSWEEVVALAKEIYDLSKKQKQQEQEQQQGEDSSPSGSDGESDEQDGESSSSDSQDGEEQDSDEQERGETADEGAENEDAKDSTEGGEENDEDSDSQSSTSDNQNDEKSETSKNDPAKSSKVDNSSEEEEEVEAEESLTEKAIEELSKQNLQDGFDAFHHTSGTVTLPVFDMEKGMVPFTEAIEDLKLMAERADGFRLYQNFLAKNKSSVAALVQEFMRRKAADEAQRTRTADTGSIDPSRLWSYRVSEEIFGSYETKREGKNHGIVFLLDWSGSMNAILKETVEQLGCMVQFCAAAGIPCEVYAFSNNCNILRDGVWSEQVGQVAPDSVRLLHLLSASARPAQLKVAIAGLLAWANKGSSHYFNLGKNAKDESLDTKYYLNGTPLNSALVAMNTVIPAFKQKTGVQIVNLAVLTDGDATDRLWYSVTSEGRKGSMWNASGNDYRRDFAKVNVMGKRAVEEFTGDTTGILRFLRNEHGINALGFRIDSTRSLMNTIKHPQMPKDSAEYKKYSKDPESYIAAKKKFLRDNDWVGGEEWYGYTEWFGVSNLKVDESDYLGTVNSTSTKANLAKALSAEIGKTKSNRPLMARIAQRVSVKN